MSKPGPSKPILVVDDDPSIRAVLRELLEMEGYRVATAEGGAEALRMAQTERPALILLDMRMPGLDGWEFAREYRARPGPHAPIVCVTAATDPKAWAKEVGAKDCIAKPFDVDVLLRTVGRFSRRRAA